MGNWWSTVQTTGEQVSTETQDEVTLWWEVGQNWITDFVENVMFSEFEKKYPSGKHFRPKNEELKIWREFASKDLNISDDYLYEMMLSRFRFESNSKVKDIS